MKKIYTILLILSLMSISLTSVSQDKKFTPGSYINNSGDTISGFFQINDMNTFSEIHFKLRMEENEWEYLPFDNCKSISIGKDEYVSWFGAQAWLMLQKWTLLLCIKIVLM